ncbi:hypothetical protein GCM10010377_68630 [Streptomyces viridiviolaceus]|uniref:DUF2304 domain-containing protein n=1 Tax=Streptomyces viridiviolaceus TaxID=68282 RepID=A0ABW2E7S5_9ACTN|nr:hypothetical protein [Streptomyces viridiviolaceus]GHB67988.1 hypothetical protein GCM10010377_68630 [Streptomyces viridiviolaceus]
MVLSISLTLLTGIVVFLLVRSGHQRILPGVACALFGFSLASTDIAPGITSAIQTVTRWISAL